MKFKTRDMILVSLFAALTAVGGIIPGIPLGPVPITLQTLFTALAGVILGARLGMWSQIVYVLVGLAGVPIFSGFTGGLSTVMAPSFGYLIGFIFCSYVIGKITEKFDKINIINISIAVAIGYAVIYAIGLPYMYIILTKVNGMSLTLYQTIKMGLLLFLPGDISKCIVTGLIGVKLVPIMKKLSNKQMTGEV